MRVANKDETFSDGIEGRCGVGGIRHIVPRARVARFGVHEEGIWLDIGQVQTTQLRLLFARQLILGPLGRTPGQGRKVLDALHTGHSGLVIAQQDQVCQLIDDGKTGLWIGAISNHVTKADPPIDTSIDAGLVDRLECFEIAVNVRQDGGAHWSPPVTRR